ncbi:MAG: LamG domain-containing protein, partial [Gammaproteobacteria bacterium]
YNGNYHYSTKTQWQLNTWYHVVMVEDGSGSIFLYIDGVLDATDSEGPRTRHPGYPFDIGGGYGGSFFQGQVDEIVVYRGALSASDVSARFNDVIGQLAR